MKKVGLLLSALLVFTLVLAGCSGGSSDKNGKTTIRAIFMKQAGYSEDDIKQMTKDFEKENKNIKVDLTFVSYEALEQKILTAAPTGDYDVVLVDQPWTAKFSKAGLIQDLTDRTKDLDKSDIYEPVMEAGTYDNKLYAMPWLNDTRYLFYNKKMLKEAGFDAPPKTWDELNKQAKVIKDKGIVKYPIVWSWKQAEALVCDVTSIFYSYNGEFIDQGKPVINNSTNLKALNAMKHVLDSGLSNPNSTEYLEEDVRSVFSNGDAAFAINWTYMYNLANDPKESKVSGDVGIALSPGTSDVKSATVNGGMGLSITKGSKHSKEAWKYISYLSAKDVQKNYTKSALPIWKSLYDDPEVVKLNPEVVKVSKEQFKYLVSRPMVPWYGQLSQKMQVEIQKALLGQQKPEDALKNVQKEASSLAKD
ncbi:ABC transporter substrate-binding protein [Sporolactobacillus terrae]|uniref:ABC transporter substrate-binding protein n=1 Tax=Sporolactobacillus terrae TaxID=269673 RepID=UPI00048A8EA0|nr:ABC transporter substrate-binding protein [Sporolactobacillus terrae]